MKGWLFLTKCGIIDVQYVQQAAQQRGSMISEYKLTVRIPRELHKKVKVKAAQQGRPISAIVRELLEEWLKEEESKESKDT
jgi:predicted HicB family RNase H-like nuclease